MPNGDAGSAAPHADARKPSDPRRRPVPSRAYKARDPKVTSTMMSAVRSKDTKPELLLRRALHQRGLRYRLHDRSVTGRPDLVFASPRVAVFVDSDWWHGRILQEEGETALRAHLRTARADWWVAKFTRNVERDAEVTAALEADGWRVLRIWESEILASLETAIERVALAVKAGRLRRPL